MDRFRATAARAAVAFVFQTPWLWMGLPAPLVTGGLKLGGAVAAFGLYHGCCVAGMAGLGVVGRIRGAWVLPFWWPVVTGAVGAGGAGCVAGMSGFEDFFGRGISQGLARNGLESSDVGWAVAYFCVVNPLVEELFWRGAVSHWFQRRFGKGLTGLALPVLGFGFWHAVALAEFLPAWLVAAGVLVITLGGWMAEGLRRRGAPIVELAVWHGLVVDFPAAVVLVSCQT